MTLLPIVLGILLALSAAGNAWQYHEAGKLQVRIGASDQLAKNTKEAADKCTAGVEELAKAGRTRGKALQEAMDKVAPKVLALQEAATLNKSNADFSVALKESTNAMVQALKESNTNTLNVLRELTAEQKKSTSAIKEGNCLHDPVMRNRPDAREFCKRLTRDDR